MYNFVIISLSRFNIEFGSNIRDIALELSKHHNVLYIDVPMKRKEIWFKKELASVAEVKERLAKKEKLVRVNDRLWHYIDNCVLESINGISSNKLFSFFNWINNRTLARVIKSAVKQVGFDEYILINDNDIYNGLHLKSLLRPALYVYYLRDYLTAMPFWKRHGSVLEPRLLNKADLVFTNSEYLNEYARKHNKNSYYVGQGCEIEHFLEENYVHHENVFQNLSRPIIGYMGALSSQRLDIDLIEWLASELKEFNFVMIGHEDLRFANSNLHHINNIHFLGRKDFETLPQYLHQFDVAINPQAVNDLTIGNYPRKIDEYLASGKPVVATWTKAMEPFADHVLLAHSKEEFKLFIQQAVADKDPVQRAQRINFAKQHTWENSVQMMLDQIDAVYAA
jgi:teichuronic acid biosynthesis glycosyltransferase TuaH